MFEEGGSAAEQAASEALKLVSCAQEETAKAIAKNARTKDRTDWLSLAPPPTR